MRSSNTKSTAAIVDRTLPLPGVLGSDEVFVGEATRMETLDVLCDGIDVGVSSLGLRTFRARPTPETVDLQANLNILERAQSAAVRRCPSRRSSGRAKSSCVPREPWIRQGGTTFVTGGSESALEQAMSAAGEKDILIAGGANTVRQFLEAGLPDELQIHLAPELLGDGVRLFDQMDLERVVLEPTRVIDSPRVTHLRYRVVASENGGLDV